MSIIARRVATVARRQVHTAAAAHAQSKESTETDAPFWLRNLLKAEPFEDPWLRYSKDVSTRSPPSPHIPGGANHKLSDNYYCNRDFKREEIPIFRIGNTETTPLMVASGEEEGGLVAVEATGPVFAGFGNPYKRSVGERIPVIGEDCNFNIPQH